MSGVIVQARAGRMEGHGQPRCHSALRAFTRFCSARSAATAFLCSHRLVPSIRIVTAPPFTKTARRWDVQGVL